VGAHGGQRCPRRGRRRLLPRQAGQRGVHFQRLLPRTLGLEGSIRAGSTSLYSLEAELF